ncbi:MAG: hypothetical protein LBO09_02745 [Candidatus Peribacteria bacterium]|nr:hypothetical protein [Candidatus Peribacteria bacterium]
MERIRINGKELPLSEFLFSPLTEKLSESIKQTYKEAFLQDAKRYATYSTHTDCEKKVASIGKDLPIKRDRLRALREISEESKDISLLKERVGQEYDLLMDHPKILDIQIENNGNITVYTDVLYCRDQYDRPSYRRESDRLRKIGKFKITFFLDPKNNNSLSKTHCINWINLDGKTYTGNENHMMAPHVNGNGWLCMGNREEFFLKALQNRELMFAIQEAIRCIEVANPDDGWGANLYKWPIATDVAEREEHLRGQLSTVQRLLDSQEKVIKRLEKAFEPFKKEIDLLKESEIATKEQITLLEAKELNIKNETDDILEESKELESSEKKHGKKLKQEFSTKETRLKKEILEKKTSIDQKIKLVKAPSTKMLSFGTLYAKIGGTFFQHPRNYLKRCQSEYQTLWERYQEKLAEFEKEKTDAQSAFTLTLQAEKNALQKALKDSSESTKVLIEKQKNLLEEKMEQQTEISIDLTAAKEKLTDLIKDLEQQENRAKIERADLTAEEVKGKELQLQVDDLNKKLEKLQKNPATAGDNKKQSPNSQMRNRYAEIVLQRAKEELKESTLEIDKLDVDIYKDIKEYLSSAKCLFTQQHAKDMSKYFDTAFDELVKMPDVAKIAVESLKNGSASVSIFTTPLQTAFGKVDIFKILITEKGFAIAKVIGKKDPTLEPIAWREYKNADTVSHLFLQRMAHYEHSAMIGIIIKFIKQWK